MASDGTGAHSMRLMRSGEIDYLHGLCAPWKRVPALDEPGMGAGASRREKQSKPPVAGLNPVDYALDDRGGTLYQAISSLAERRMRRISETTTPAVRKARPSQS